MVISAPNSNVARSFGTQVISNTLVAPHTPVARSGEELPRREVGDTHCDRHMQRDTLFGREPLEVTAQCRQPMIGKHYVPAAASIAQEIPLRSELPWQGPRQYRHLPPRSIACQRSVQNHR